MELIIRSIRRRDSALNCFFSIMGSLLLCKGGCGDTIRKEYDYHYTIDREYDLGEYGACGGTLITRECACGQVKNLEYYQECSLSWIEESYVDGNGIKHELQNRTCSKCGFVYSIDLYRAAEGCFDVYYCTVTAKRGVTVILENYEYSYEKENHSYTYEYELMGTVNYQLLTVNSYDN